MMRPIRLTSKLAGLFLVAALCCRCGGDLEGIFYLSDEARRYMIDTTIRSFHMVDNLGMTEAFYMDEWIWYRTHHYFSEWGSDGDAYGEAFGVAYLSSVNDYAFMFVLRAQVGYTEMEIEWNQRDRLAYNLTTKKVISGVTPEILFYDSLTVKGVTYRNMIEIDYSGKINEIDDFTPVKTFISGEKGLVKFIRKDGITLERISTITEN